MNDLEALDQSFNKLSVNSLSKSSPSAFQLKSSLTRLQQPPPLPNNVIDKQQNKCKIL